MTIRSARETFREYAASVGCTAWDDAQKAYYAPDRSRRIAFSESFPDRIIVRDSALPLGKASISRERRVNEALAPVTQSMETAEGGPCGRPRHKGLPGKGERESKQCPTLGQMTLAL